MYFYVVCYKQHYHKILNVMKTSSTKNIQFISLIFILFITSTLLYAQENNLVLKEIKGIVTHLNVPLSEVHIQIKNKNYATKTDGKGFYTIKAEIGDFIQYSYVGYNTVTIIVEDVTNILNIELTLKLNELDEAVVTARKKVGKVLELSEKSLKKFNSAIGNINPRASGFSIPFIDGEEISNRYGSIAEAINGKIAGVTGGKGEIYLRYLTGGSAIWDVDGQIFNNEPPLDLNNILDIHILKNAGSTTLYGTEGRNGVVVVRTKNGSFESSKEKKELLKKVTDQYTNKNYYTDDAVTLNDDTSFSSNTVSTIKNNIDFKDISGTITYLEAPLQHVNITVVNKKIGVQTSAQGTYSIKAEVGDILQYSFVGFRTVNIVVEDITNVLNIEMIMQTNALDEVVVTAINKKGEVLVNALKADEKFVTARGTFNPKTVGYAVPFIDGEEINLSAAPSLSQAIAGKVAGARMVNGKLELKAPTSVNNPTPVIWEVDGAIYDQEPWDLDLTQIKSIHILKSLAATNRYGSQGAGGVVVIETKFGSYNNSIEAKRKKVTEQYTNKNYYNNDAVSVNKEALFSNLYTSTLSEIGNKTEAFYYYNNALKNKITAYNVHIGIAQLFMLHYNDVSFSKQILDDLAITHNKNPEVLKAIAYQFQALGLKNESINIYESIFKLRPKYAQSYRDLANAYIENDRYKKGWRLYMSYLLQGNDVSGEGIGQVVYNEMEWLFFNRKNQTDIKELFVPKNETLLDFRNDVRMVFEWNTSEAEFDLEFVNPEKQVYVFEHSLAANQDLITHEKEKGYSSKEFFIDNIGEGEWLINIIYNGNKKPAPTYFKVTTYYHWGKSNQISEIAVYKFEEEGVKVQLYRLNKEVLVAVN